MNSDSHNAPHFSAATRFAEKLRRVVRPRGRITIRWSLLPRLLLVATMWALAAWFAARLLISEHDLPRADVIYVFAGSSAYVERAQLAARLFKEERAPKIVLADDGEQSGWSSVEQRNPFFVERARRELENSGVPSEKIEVLPQIVTGTHSEALALNEYTKARGLHSVLAVTSPYHARRALWMLRRALRGSNVEPGLLVAAPVAADETPSVATWWLHARGWQIIAGEYVKFIYYLLWHR